MTMNTRTKLLAVMAAMGLVLASCGGDDDSPDTSGPDASVVTDPDTDTADDGTAPPADGEIEDAPTVDDPTVAGGGVILADLCAGGQPLNGAISLDDLVSFGLLGSADATAEGSAAYTASAYETFGFLCNISDAGGDFVTIGVQSGSDLWDLALEQGDGTVEEVGGWDVLISGNWLSPLTMRFTDSEGNQDSLFASWTPGDGSIPDADTLLASMRPLADAIVTRATVEIPRS